MGVVFVVVLALAGFEGGSDEAAKYHAPANFCLLVILQVRRQVLRDPEVVGDAVDDIR
jgi:hypothetical protein